METLLRGSDQIPIAAHTRDSRPSPSPPGVLGEGRMLGSSGVAAASGSDPAQNRGVQEEEGWHCFSLAAPDSWRKEGLEYKPGRTESVFGVAVSGSHNHEVRLEPGVLGQGYGHGRARSLHRAGQPASLCSGRRAPPPRLAAPPRKAWSNPPQAGSSPLARSNWVGAFCCTRLLTLIPPPTTLS